MKKIVILTGLILFFILGFISGRLYYEPQDNKKTEDFHIIQSQIENLSKLVVAKTGISSIHRYSDTKVNIPGTNLTFFDKKVVVLVNAKVEIGYNLNELDITLDSINKKIIVNYIPDQDITIVPNIKYVSLDQSTFFKYSSKEHNDIRETAILNIKLNPAFNVAKKQAKSRLLIELSKIFQLSKVYHWEVVNKTSDTDLFNDIKYLNENYKG